MNDLLRARDLRFGYGAGKMVVDGVSLSVAPGSVAAIIGANGCGKSTLIRLLAGILKPAAGSITFEDVRLGDISPTKIVRKIAYVPQNTSTAFPFTALAVVLTGRNHIGRARAAMERLGIEHLAERPMTELSGGERQLVSLARALAQDASCLLLDEPSASLDLKHRAAILRLLIADRERVNRSALIVTHDFALLDPCDVVFALRDGRIAAAGRPADVLSGSALREIYQDPDVRVRRIDGRTFVWSEQFLEEGLPSSRGGVPERSNNSLEREGRARSASAIARSLNRGRSGVPIFLERPPRLRRFGGFATSYYCRIHPSSRGGELESSFTLRTQLWRAGLMLGALVVVSAVIASVVGYQSIQWSTLWSDEMSRSIFFRLRLPRVVMAGLIGSTLALIGAALQALFRNPLADPFVLGVSGGAALGASVAITFGWGAHVLGLPVVFITASLGAAATVVVAYRIACRAGQIVSSGTLLLAGVVINLIANAGVITIQYFADYTRALQILRWLIGSLDVVGFDLIVRMMLVLIPAWIVLLAFSNDLHLFAVDEETAVTLGVNVRRLELYVYTFSCVGIGITVATAGMIGFVGLIVPHIVRHLFGQDVRIVLPCSALLGAAFLILTDAFARTILGQAELPVGAITGILGGPFFLWLLQRQRNTAIGA